MSRTGPRWTRLGTAFLSAASTPGPGRIGFLTPKAARAQDQLDWKRHQVHKAWRTGIDESRRALSQLAEQITTSGIELIVYNALSWARDVDVEVEMPAGQVLALGEQQVPFEVLDDIGGSQRVRLTVPDVPALGYAHRAGGGAGHGGHQPLRRPGVPTERPGPPGRAGPPGQRGHRAEAATGPSGATGPGRAGPVRSKANAGW